MLIKHLLYLKHLCTFSNPKPGVHIPHVGGVSSGTALGDNGMDGEKVFMARTGERSFESIMVSRMSHFLWCGSCYGDEVSERHQQRGGKWGGWE